jgi:hypothetical protein
VVGRTKASEVASEGASAERTTCRVYSQCVMSLDGNMSHLPPYWFCCTSSIIPYDVKDDPETHWTVCHSQSGISCYRLAPRMTATLFISDFPAVFVQMA